MFGTPFKVGLRELRLSKGRAALVAGILALQASALSGGILGFESLFHTRDVHYRELRFADLEVQFVPATVPEMPALDALAKIPGVAAVDRRFVSLGYIERGTGAETKTLPVVVHYLDADRRPNVNDLAIAKGTFLSAADPDAAVVDRLFAEQHHLGLGDTLVVNPNRFAQKITIAGVALSPEYLVPTANPDLMVPDKGSLGVVFASHAKLDALFVDPLYNQLVFRYEPNVDAEKTRQAVLAALAGLDVERATPKEANFGYRYVEEVIGGSRIFMPATSTLLALIAAIATMVSMRRILTARRREMGALLAHGYSPWQLIAGFMVFGIVPGIAGALLGIPGGAQLGTNLALNNADVAGMPAPIMIYPAKYFAIGGASAIVVGLVSVLVPALSLMRMSPAVALRGGEEVRYRALPAILDRFVVGSLAWRYAMRNIFRRLRLSFATSSLIALSVAMPASMLTILSCWDAWTDSYVKTIAWDVTTTFKVPLDEEQTRAAVAVKGVVDYEAFLQKHATLARPDCAACKEQETRVRGLPVPTRLAALDLVSGAYFSGPDADEAILNTAFSRGVTPPKVGERVRITFKGKARALRVVGTISDGSLGTMYVPLGTAQAFFDAKGKTTGANLVVGDGAIAPALVAKAPALPAVGLRPDAAEALDVDVPQIGEPSAVDPGGARTDVAAVKERLLANEIVTAVQAKIDFREATTRYLKVFHSITIPLIGEGCALAFFFLLSMLSFLLLEREPEYATLRTMGYGPLEIAKMVLVEVVVLGGVGLLFSIGSWLGTTRILLELMKVAWFEIPLAVQPSDWLFVALPIGLFLVLAAVPGIRGLLRLDLAAATRARAMG